MLTIIEVPAENRATGHFPDVPSATVLPPSNAKHTIFEPDFNDPRVRSMPISSLAIALAIWGQKTAH